METEEDRFLNAAIGAWMMAKETVNDQEAVRIIQTSLEFAYERGVQAAFPPLEMFGGIWSAAFSAEGE